jgi:hypothetical protein
MLAKQSTWQGSASDFLCSAGVQKKGRKMRPFFKLLQCDSYHRQLAGRYLAGAVPPLHTHTIGPL